MRLSLLSSLVLSGPLALVAQDPIRTNNPPSVCATNPSSDTTIVSLTLIDSPPIHREIGPLRYPRERVPRGSTLVVRLRFVVNADGRPDSASIGVAESPDSVLTQAARRSLLASRYWPACRGVVAVRTGPIEQRFRFQSR